MRDLNWLFASFCSEIVGFELFYVEFSNALIAGFRPGIEDIPFRLISAVSIDFAISLASLKLQ